MLYRGGGPGPLETKFCGFDGELALKEGAEIAGYASLFGAADQGGDVVQKGAYGVLAGAARQGGVGGEDALAARPDPADRGLGRGARGRPGASTCGAAAARGAGGARGARAVAGGRDRRAVDRLPHAQGREGAGGQRLLHEIELWEVSLVTFPMLPEARVQAVPSDAEADLARTLAESFREAREMLA